MRRHLILAALFSIASIGAQAAPKKRSIVMPANYEDCMQPAVLETLVQEGPGVWGLSHAQNTEAFRAAEGYFLCSAYAGRGEEGCSLLQEMPDFKFAKQMGLQCRTEYNVLKFHDSMRAKQDEQAIRHCSRWCRLNKTESDKQLVCPNVCRLALKELRRDPDNACEKVIGKAADNLGASSEYRSHSTLFCRQKFTPKLSDCVDNGDGTAVDCKAMIALLRAYSKGDEKRCPKDARYSGVCKAMIIQNKTDEAAQTGGVYDGPEALSACDENGRIFTKLVCDARKATGGLQQQMDRPKRGSGY